MTRAHDEALEAAARAMADAINWTPSMFYRALLADATHKAIRAYLAHRRASDGAVLVVVPEDKPFSMRDGVYATERRIGYNAALAAVRASGEDAP